MAQELKRLPTVQRTLHPLGSRDDQDSLPAVHLRGVSVTCSKLSCDMVDSACDGGLMDDGFAFAKKNAMCTEDSHSHTGAKDTSSTSSCTVGLAQESVTGCKDMAVNSVETLMTTLTQQPLFSRYRSLQRVLQVVFFVGSRSSGAARTSTHEVLAVSYGSDFIYSTNGRILFSSVRIFQLLGVRTPFTVERLGWPVSC